MSLCLEQEIEKKTVKSSRMGNWVGFAKEVEKENMANNCSWCKSKMVEEFL